MPVCQNDSFWGKKVLSIAKVGMLLGTLHGSAASITLAGGVFLVSILQKGDLASVPLGLSGYSST